MDVSYNENYATVEETDTLIPKPRRRKWPILFWVILKMLGLFSYKESVTERKCFTCFVDEYVGRRGFSRRNNGRILDLDYLLLSYESDVCEGFNNSLGNHGEPICVNNIQEDDTECEACATLWWNFLGVPDRYTAKEIGAKPWSHAGSALLSVVMLLTSLGILWYDMGYYLSKLWGAPDQILHLLLKSTLIIVLTVHNVFALCSKIRSYFKTGTSKLSWATALNARYLIKRAQLVDLPGHGLPGKFFLSLCIACPLIVMTYRGIIFICISQCGATTTTAMTSAVGFLFFESWGLYIYILYFIRVSFQRQFSLLLAYIKMFEGDMKRCRGALLSVVSDFNCFRQLCSLYSVLQLPCAVVAVFANATWSYMLSGSCAEEDKSILNIESHLQVLAWTEISIAFMLYSFSLGGFEVEYLWDDFLLNLVYLKSEKYETFWKKLLLDKDQIVTKSHALLATMIVSVIGIYMAINFSGQNVLYLTSTCNGTDTAQACL